MREAKKELKKAQTIMQMDELKCRKRVLRRYITIYDIAVILCNDTIYDIAVILCKDSIYYVTTIFCIDTIFDVKALLCVGWDMLILLML